MMIEITITIQETSNERIVNHGNELGKNYMSLKIRNNTTCVALIIFHFPIHSCLSSSSSVIVIDVFWGTVLNNVMI